MEKQEIRVPDELQVCLEQLSAIVEELMPEPGFAKRTKTDTTHEKSLTSGPAFLTPKAELAQVPDHEDVCREAALSFWRDSSFCAREDGEEENICRDRILVRCARMIRRAMGFNMDECSRSILRDTLLLLEIEVRLEADSEDT